MLRQDARGDQCDQCGNLLAAEDLINPKCKLTGTTPMLRPTKHIYLDLPSLTPQLQDYITSSSQAGGWSSNCVQARCPVSSPHAHMHLSQQTCRSSRFYGVPYTLQWHAKVRCMGSESTEDLHCCTVMCNMVYPVVEHIFS